MKRPYIFIFLLVLLSCEAELDLSRVDGEQCIFLCTMIGNSPESKENLLYAIPCIPIAGEDIGALDAKVTLSGTAAHKSISGSTEKVGCFEFSVSPAQSRRSEPFGCSSRSLLCAAGWRICQLRCPDYAKILASLKMKNGISLTPLNCALKAFTFALNDSADAFVERLSK